MWTETDTFSGPPGSVWPDTEHCSRQSTGTPRESTRMTTATVGGHHRQLRVLDAAVAAEVDGGRAGRRHDAQPQSAEGRGAGPRVGTQPDVRGFHFRDSQCIIRGTRHAPSRRAAAGTRNGPDQGGTNKLP